MNRMVIPSLLLATMLLSACGVDTADKIQMQVSDGYIQYFNGESWENLVALEELRGPQGPQGPAGADGKDGKDGVDGKDGRNGIDGKDGAPGTPGADGLNGADGRDGTDGKDGADGRDGEDGKDGSTAELCEHSYNRVSQVSEVLEDRGDSNFLLRRTETMICDKCGYTMQIYYDFVSHIPGKSLSDVQSELKSRNPENSFDVSMQSETENVEASQSVE